MDKDFDSIDPMQIWGAVSGGLMLLAAGLGPAWPHMRSSSTFDLPYLRDIAVDCGDVSANFNQAAGSVIGVRFIGGHAEVHRDGKWTIDSDKRGCTARDGSTARFNHFMGYSAQFRAS